MQLPNNADREGSGNVVGTTSDVVAGNGNGSGSGSGDGGGGGGGGDDAGSTPSFVVSKYGTKQIMLRQHTFNRHICRDDVTYWRCSQFAVLRCRARLKTKSDTLTVLNSEHNHEVISKARKYGSLKRQRAEAEAAARVQTKQAQAEQSANSATAD